MYFSKLTMLYCLPLYIEICIRPQKYNRKVTTISCGLIQLIVEIVFDHIIGVCNIICHIKSHKQVEIWFNLS